MSTLPSGTVTFLFTDIEESTRLLRELGSDRYAATLERHRVVLRDAFARHNGVELGTQGDGFFFAFSRASEALEAAREGQLALASTTVRVRMGVHTGEPLVVAGEYVGIDVHKGARIAAAGHGGQVLLSEQTARLAGGDGVVDLGVHRLKDLTRPEPIFQLLGPGLHSDFPPLRTLDVHPNNLPLQSTPLIGRDGETAAVIERLRVPGTRLVTLTGPAGTGKTRLGLQVAAELLEEFPDGVFFIDLAPISDPDRVLSAIARTLGVREEGERPPLAMVCLHLRDRRTLLLLDNFEQVVDGAGAVAELIATVAGVQVLATSRIPLRLRGEREFPVEPLSHPGPYDHPPLERLAQYPSVRLFIERATAVRPEFVLTTENARAVAEICRRLDGLPLAIELAAARARILTPQAMLSRLERSLKLLTGGPRDLPARQQTLRDAIAWSHDLLDVEEKALFRRLAIFSGGGTLAAVERVCSNGGLQIDALDGVTSLVEKSLLRQGENAGAEPTVSMLETVREYAREQLEQSGEADRIARRHVEFYLHLAEEALPHLVGPDQRRWLAHLEGEHDNLRAALRWALDHGETEVAGRIAGAVQTFWMAHGHLREGRQWYNEVLASPGQCAPTARVRVLRGAGALARQLGELHDAEAYLGESLRISREIDDARGVAMALMGLGAVRGERGEIDASEPIFEESLSILRQLGEKRLMAMVLTNLGVTAEARGDRGRAGALYSESLALSRTIGDGAGVSLALSNLGHLAYDEGDYDLAEERFRESLGMARASGHTYNIVHEVANLALVAAARGHLESAARLFAAAEAHFEALGARRMGLAREKYEGALTSARRLGEGASWNEAWRHGAEMTLSEMVEFALGRDEPRSVRQRLTPS
jgi:predicted ATPase/class 3 adenylate cyclase